MSEYIQIKFQEGLSDRCQVEDVLKVVVDRLEFLSRDYKTREKLMAINKIQEALLWLGPRERQRIKRGVEGTSQS